MNKKFTNDAFDSKQKNFDKKICDYSRKKIKITKLSAITMHILR